MEILRMRTSATGPAVVEDITAAALAAVAALDTDTDEDEDLIDLEAIGRPVYWSEFLDPEALRAEAEAARLALAD